MRRAAADADTVVVRPRKTMLDAWVCAVVVFVLFVVVAVVLRTADTGVFFRLADQIAMAAIGALIAGGVLLLARPRVRANAEGIEVRNVLVTRTLPWDVVERVAFPDGASWARLELIGDDYLCLLYTSDAADE